MNGDAEVARAAGLMAEPARAKVLMALADGRLGVALLEGLVRRDALRRTDGGL